MGIIFLGFLMLLTGISVEFPGLIAYALDPVGEHVTEVDKAYPFVVKTLVATGLKGLVLAGLCGAVMSTIEALVHSSSTIFTMDLYSRFKSNPSEGHLIKVGRITTTVLLIAGTALAPIVKNFESIFDFFQKCWSMIAAPTAAVFLLAVLWKRTTRAAAFWTLMLALPLFFVPHGVQIAERELGWQINEYNMAGVLLLISLAFGVVVSLLTKAPRAEQIEGLVWRPTMMRLSEAEIADYKWYKNLWLWCAIWVGVMVAIYIKFW
jgi:SSS family solute:Na+ symporter